MQPSKPNLQHRHLLQPSTLRGGWLATLTRDIAAELSKPAFPVSGPVLPLGTFHFRSTGRRGEAEHLNLLFSGPEGYDPYLAVQAIEEEFLSRTKTLSARLIEGLQLANRRVAIDNLRSMARERCRPGLATVVFRGTDAYIALAGSFWSYLVRDGQLFGLVQRLSTPELGEDEPSVPIFDSVIVQKGDIILVSDRDLLDFAPAERIAAWFETGIRDGLAWASSSTRDSAVVAAFEGKPEIVIVDHPREHSEKGEHEDLIRSLAKLELGDSVNELSKRFATGMEHFPEMFGRLVHSGARALVPSKHEDTVVIPSEVMIEPERSPVVKSRPALQLNLSEDPVVAFIQKAAKNVDLSAVRSHPRVVTVGVGLTLAILLIAAFTIFGKVFGGEHSEQAFTAAMSDAERAKQAATGSTDPAFARVRLREADFAIQRALTIKKEDQAAKNVSDAIKTEMAKLDRVVRIPNPAPVSDLAAAGAKNPISLVVEGGSGYVLDDSGWGVRKVGLEPNKPNEPQIIATKGSKSDESDVGEPMLMAWMARSEARQTTGLLVLDKERQMFVLPTGRSLLEYAVRGAAGWGGVSSFKSYAGNLYVLDPKGNQIWRYLPTYAGFDSEMKGMVDGMNLEDARDFSLDGDIYILGSSGKVTKVSNGAAKEFDLRPLDKPMDRPVAIVTGATAQNVYVADAGNSRVLVFDKEGRFQRQIVNDTFADMKSLVVDEALGKMYYIAGKKLYATALPKNATSASPAAVPQAAP